MVYSHYAPLTTPTGKIWMSDIASELGISATGLSLNDSRVRRLAGKPTNNSYITMADLRGKTNWTPNLYITRAHNSQGQVWGYNFFWCGSVDNSGIIDGNRYGLMSLAYSTRWQDNFNSIWCVFSGIGNNPVPTGYFDVSWDNGTKKVRVPANGYIKNSTLESMLKTSGRIGLRFDKV